MLSSVDKICCSNLSGSSERLLLHSSVCSLQICIRLFFQKFLAKYYIYKKWCLKNYVLELNNRKRRADAHSQFTCKKLLWFSRTGLRYALKLCNNKIIPLINAKSRVILLIILVKGLIISMNSNNNEVDHVSVVEFDWTCGTVYLTVTKGFFIFICVRRNIFL